MEVVATFYSGTAGISRTFLCMRGLNWQKIEIASNTCVNVNKTLFTFIRFYEKVGADT